MGLAGLALVLGSVGLAVVPAPSTAMPPVPATAPATELVRKVSYEGKPATLRLQPISVRSAGYEVLLQQDDGSYVAQKVAPEQAYLGTVDQDPSGVATGIVDSDGRFRGSVVFDRGVTWHVEDTEAGGETLVTEAVTERPAAYTWPSASSASRNVSTRPGQVGATTYGWTIGFDVDNRYLHSATMGGSVARVADQIDYFAVSMLGYYMTDALLRPSIGRIVIRGSLKQDPYLGLTSTGAGLSRIKSQWNAHHTSAGVDAATTVWSLGRGGMAYLGGIASGIGYAASSGPGRTSNALQTMRHELGHLWGVHDDHTHHPEGPTINSGNSLARFDGTEVSAMMRTRDNRLARPTPPFENLGRFGPTLPPYAALDLVDHVHAGVPFTISPAANDHDANGDSLALASVESTSHLGGKVKQTGPWITYTSPKVATQTVDWVTYVVRDATGRTAKGVVLFRVSPPA